MLPLLDWLLLAGLCAMGAMAPGISLAMVTRHTLRSGHRAGMIAAVTHALAVGLWALATVSGLALLFRAYPRVETIFSLTGAAFLLWMAHKSWQAAKQPLPAEQDVHGSLHSAARDGFMVAFINPKVALFFLALFSQFLNSEMGHGARAQMVATATIIDGAWYVLVAALLDRSGLLPWLRTHHHYIEKATAVLLVIVASGVMMELWL